MICGCKSFKINYIIGCFQLANNRWCSFMTIHTYIPNIIESPWAINNSLTIYTSKNISWSKFSLSFTWNSASGTKLESPASEMWGLSSVSSKILDDFKFLWIMDGEQISWRYLQKGMQSNYEMLADWVSLTKENADIVGVKYNSINIIFCQIYIIIMA